jgi:hypothetical protein
MTRPIAVFSGLGTYRVAAAELPASARLADSPDRAIVVVSGGSWWDAAIRAFEEGAAGVVVARPAPVPGGALSALESAANSRPLIIERPLLRADVAGAAIAARMPAPTALVVECHAPAASLPAALRDALGWARLLGGGPLTLSSAQAGRARGVALLETAAGLPVSLVFAAQPGAPALGRLRLTALGTTLIEVDGDETELHLSMTDAASRRTAPPRFERPERLTLRRAIAAAVGGEHLSDLIDLARDAALAEAVTTVAADAAAASVV